ncbi:outer membrane protein [Methylovirgula sp. HY1]|uniref:outer membrane protein n=1 Tax=Methylovirgula sp. HY1 TaxID=2822761 RepID=UPI001C5BA8D8|nr:outer membrane protein [Methylovirgula sp. HY1]QXX76485.1 hypothetical protein MHY1_p00007 [Methylovirgula sp. HY1]
MFCRILLTTAAAVAFGGTALAADLPTTKGPPVYTPPPPIFTWSGVYIGGQVGYAWGRAWTESTYFFPAPIGTQSYALPPVGPSGVIGGAHVGYNYQTGSFVFGVEGDVNGSSYNGSAIKTNAFLGTFSLGTREPIDASIRGRAGYAWNRALLYATGGVALGGLDNFNTLGDSAHTTAVGWTVGGGVEYAIDNNWSARVEYRYTDFGRDYFTAPGAAIFGFIPNVSSRQIENRVQAGFSYKFDMFIPPTPIVSKY